MHGFLLCAPAGRLYKMLPTTPHTQPLPGITCIRFGLIRFRSPLLSESLLFSLPVGTEMFHFPTFPPHTLYIQARVTGHDSSQVSPFGHPRITARLPTPQGLSQAPTSFIGSRCQGIHHVPFIACHNTHTTARPNQSPATSVSAQNTTQHPHHPHPPTRTTPNKGATHDRTTRASTRVRGTTNCYKDARVHYGNLKQHTPTPRHHPASRGPARKPRHRTTHPHPGHHPPHGGQDRDQAGLILQNPNSVPLTYSPTQTPGVTRQPHRRPPHERHGKTHPSRPTHPEDPPGPGRTEATGGSGVDGSTSKQPRPAPRTGTQTGRTPPHRTARHKTGTLRQGVCC